VSVPVLASVRLDRRGGVGILELCRPEAGNALDNLMLGELLTAVRWLQQQDWLRALVLSGAGRAFCVGGDLHEYAGVFDDVAAAQSLATSSTSTLNEVILGLHEVNIPVLAALTGQVSGAGFSLALLCDVRICSRRAVLDFAYARIGTATDGGMTFFLPHVVGRAAARRLLLFQPLIRGPEALALGLVDELTEPAETIAVAIEHAQQLSRRATTGVAAAKRLLRPPGLAEHLHAEAQLFIEGACSSEMRDGVTALLHGEASPFC